MINSNCNVGPFILIGLQLFLTVVGLDHESPREPSQASPLNLFIGLLFCFWAMPSNNKVLLLALSSK